MRRQDPYTGYPVRRTFEVVDRHLAYDDEHGFVEYMDKRDEGYSDLVWSGRGHVVGRSRDKAILSVWRREWPT